MKKAWSKRPSDPKWLRTCGASQNKRVSSILPYLARRLISPALLKTALFKYALFLDWQSAILLELTFIVSVSTN
jgi:hypothetical protein